MVFFVTILLLFLAIVHFYHNWRIQPYSLFLSGALMIIALMFVTHYVLIYGFSVLGMTFLFGHFTSLYYLLGPFLYFYIRATLTNRCRLGKRDLWHFLPAVLEFVLLSKYIFQPWDFKWQLAQELVQDISRLRDLNDLFFLPTWVTMPLRFVSMLGYTSYTLCMVWQFRRNYPSRMRIPLRDATTLFRFLIYLLVVCLVTEIAFFIMVLTFFGDRSLAATDVGSHPLILLSALGVVSIPFLMQVHPMVLYGAPRLTVADAEPLKGKIKNKVEVKVEEVEDTNAADVEIRFQKLTDEILLIMVEEQLYLQPDFSLEDLAEQMDVPKHHLYYCFSHFLKTKFTRLRTEYRVAHACRLIETGATREKTLEAIGLESGFGNRITFASSFREVKGVSPREYVNVVSARS